jgi:tripartite-type tricarboxylate transporter receptor subunit TctC
MKRTILAAAVAASFVFTAAAPAVAEWPADRPIHVIVGFGAGGGTDIVSRIVAQSLSELLKQSVIVENKVGAGGTLAAEYVARADKDGYTALMTSPAHTVSAAMLKSIRYDAVKDYAPVSWVADSAFVFVAKKDFSANGINGLIVLARRWRRSAQSCMSRRRMNSASISPMKSTNGKRFVRRPELNSNSRRASRVRINERGLKWPTN